MDSTQLNFYNESLASLGIEEVSEAYYIDLSDVVWAYYYKQTGRHAQSYMRMYNTKKRMLYVNASEKIALQILEYLDQTTSHMVLGYSKELEQTFNKNFNEFLNIRYNTSKSDVNELF